MAYALSAVSMTGTGIQGVLQTLHRASAFASTWAASTAWSSNTPIRGDRHGYCINQRSRFSYSCRSIKRMAWRHSVQEQEQYSSTHRRRLSWLFCSRTWRSCKSKERQPVKNFQLRGLALILKLLALAHISAKLKKRSFRLTLF